jgi:DNA-directed RNA polymerase subunit RPC12/RpoP
VEPSVANFVCCKQEMLWLVKCMTVISCPKCGSQILLVPDLKAMARAIHNHVESHVVELRKQGGSSAEIQGLREGIEVSLLEAVLRGICDGGTVHSE